LELLDLLCQVIDAIRDRQSPDYKSASHLKLLKSLEIRLQGLEQHHSGISSSEPDEAKDEKHQRQVAELYRLATLIYLLRIAKDDGRDAPGVTDAIDKAYRIIKQVDYCERPWPLFVIGLDANTEEQRLAVLTVIDRALDLQPLGPMALANRMIRDAWVQQDLCESGQMDYLPLYGRVISRNRVPPCFT
jgi:hypothetical protein